MSIRSFFVLVLLFVGSSAQATEFHTADHLKSAVESFLLSELQRKRIVTPLSTASNDHLSVPAPKITASNLDPRLKLQKCSNQLGMTLLSQTGISKNVSVKVECSRPKKWSVYVPATLEIYGPVLVLRQPLRRGTIVSEDHINIEIRDIMALGDAYMEHNSQAVGMQLKRNLNAGQVLRLSHLKPARIIKKGDKVVIEAAFGALSVVTAAKALSHGTVGEQIQVKNTHSNRVIDARVVGPGRVRVVM